MKALIISADNFEDSELLVPYYRLKEAGVEVTVASLSAGLSRASTATKWPWTRHLTRSTPTTMQSWSCPEGRRRRW